MEGEPAGPPCIEARLYPVVVREVGVRFAVRLT